MTANKPSDAIPEVMKRRIKELERDGYNEDFLRCFRNAIRSLDETDRYAHANKVQAKEIRDLREWLDDEIQGRRDLMEELTAVVERLAEAERDAARYRFIRNCCEVTCLGVEIESDAHIDQYLDAWLHEPTDSAELVQK